MLPKLHLDEDYPCSLVGNWNTWYGEQDQAGEVPTSPAPLPPSLGLRPQPCLATLHTLHGGIEGDLSSCSPPQLTPQLRHLLWLPSAPRVAHEAL